MHEKFKTLFAALIISVVLFYPQAVMAENAAIGAGGYGAERGLHDGKNTGNSARHAVIDKISGGFATFLVGEDELEMIVDIASLENGMREGDWLLMYENGDFVVDPELTEKRRKAVRDRLEMLRGK